MLEQLTRPKARIRLKQQKPDATKTRFDAWMESEGHFTDAAKAEALGLSRTVVQKTRQETQAPSAEFIAAFFLTYPQLAYRDYFEETTEPLRSTAEAA